MDCFATTRTAHPFGAKIEGLLQGMLSPLTGLDRALGFSLHDRGHPGIFVSVAQLSAVHRLLGWPKALAYHLGGYGVTREEALIRALGESAERYAQMTCLLTGERARRYDTANALRAEGLRVMSFEGWNFFSEEQYARKSGYRRFDPALPLTWLETTDLTDGSRTWVPASLLVLGYEVKKGELCVSPAFTTGTAAHTIPARALNSAMLELIQIDATMGTWYGGVAAREIELDDRLSDLRAIVADAGCSASNISFHYVKSPDFDVHVVACVFRPRHGDDLPAASVATACELKLQKACYRAFLEASSVRHLGQLGCLGKIAVLRGEQAIDPSAIADLDLNVLYYSLPGNGAALDRHFPRGDGIAASQLPRYTRRSDSEVSEQLIDRFRMNGMRLYYLDLTTPDIRDLGFTVCRTYSPSLLSLCFPSNPQAGHPRYAEYGGVNVADPHPYP